jgi:hypothetical protein
LVCDDGNLCTDDSCSALTGCVFSLHARPCDDGNACTQTEACTGGVCVPKVPGEAACNDGNPCTDDTCQPATGCAHASNSASCLDSDPCTISHCSQSACLATGWVTGCCHVDADCFSGSERCDEASQTCESLECVDCDVDADCGPAPNRCYPFLSGDACALGCVQEGEPCPEAATCVEVSSGAFLCLPSQGDCECVSKVQKGCHEGDVYWMTSCGAPEVVAQHCGVRGCAKGVCCPTGTVGDGDACTPLPPSDVDEPETVEAPDEVLAPEPSAEPAVEPAAEPAADVQGDDGPPDADAVDVRGGAEGAEQAVAEDPREVDESSALPDVVDAAADPGREIAIPDEHLEDTAGAGGGSGCGVTSPLGRASSVGPIGLLLLLLVALGVGKGKARLQSPQPPSRIGS